MSVGFSIVFYNTSSHELARQVPPPSSFGLQRYEDFRGSGPRIDVFFERRISEAREQLFIKLFIVNALTLVAGGVVSYALARRTLQPIEENMEAQAQFVSDASHELRTPLTAIQTTNQVALRRKSISTADAKELLQYNIHEAEKLQGITDSLLRLAKLDNDVLALESVPANDVLSDALNNVMNAALAKDIAIDDTAAKGLQVQVERGSFTQAVTTILDNAVKYSPAGSTVHIDVMRHGRYAIFEIRDTGVGIAAEHLPHIFERFYRVDESRNKQQHDGFGIGLALAKKIIDKHGGEISVTSVANVGTTFTLKILAGQRADQKR